MELKYRQKHQHFLTSNGCGSLNLSKITDNGLYKYKTVKRRFVSVNVAAIAAYRCSNRCVHEMKQTIHYCHCKSCLHLFERSTILIAHTIVHRVIQEATSIMWEVIVPVVVT
jgi:hypothetical protein